MQAVVICEWSIPKAWPISWIATVSRSAPPLPQFWVELMKMSPASEQPLIGGGRKANPSWFGNSGISADSDVAFVRVPLLVSGGSRPSRRRRRPAPG